jgi:hypothetical protein
MYYTTDINEEIIKGVADEMVAGGCVDSLNVYCVEENGCG